MTGSELPALHEHRKPARFKITTVVALGEASRVNSNTELLAAETFAYSYIVGGKEEYCIAWQHRVDTLVAVAATAARVIAWPLKSWVKQ